ncbi:PI31 proteasome regulator N-terminal-domain-containing protein [Chaetomium fimeti]|uniref:PI31 proteasome regulator N-terminal-domain-containing protein n=1 Tax=Chaetomium fimeti TaxID=1854472 RepID=A0AAE0HDD5_9PEZI|nr:PI31 proteasome regulator N-terminal-domain-containing protein [Chaetomium fimeti]
MILQDPLGPAAVLQSMAKVLPIHQKGDATSDLSTSLDCIALFVHACMANLGFTLVGFNEDRNIEDECARHAPHLLSRWNRSLSSHGFVYTHDKSSARFVLHVDRLAGKVEVRGLATNDEQIARFDINARDYVNTSALPLRITLTSDGEEDRSDLVEKLKPIYISDDRMKDLSRLLKTTLIQQFDPNLQEEGGDDTNTPLRRSTPPPQQLQQQPPRQHEPPRPSLPAQLPEPAVPHPYPAPDPLAAPRPAPAADFPPPGFEDEYEVNRPARGPLGGGQPAGPGFGGLGHDDLYPAGLGPHDPITGSFTGGGVGPEGLRQPGGNVRGGGGGGGGFGGFGGAGGRGGGMHPTFDDPIFQGPGARGGDGTFGGQVPPGARWDPYGPGGQPRFGGRGGGGSGFGGGFGGFGGGDII